MRLMVSIWLIAAKKSIEFFLCVKDHHMERRAGYMLVRPFDFNSIVSRLHGIISTQNSSVSLALALTLGVNFERSFRAPNSHCQLSGSSASSVTNESTLIQR